MATVIVGRELLVTSLRGMIEGAGGDFSANQLGKWKMVLQCGAVISLLAALIEPDVAILDQIGPAFLWSAMALTVYSEIDYSRAAAKIMSSAATETDSK